MSIDLGIIANWIELDYIQYMLMSGVFLGVMGLIKKLAMRS